MIPISKNGPDMASVHNFWYFLRVTYLFIFTKIPSFGFPFKIPDDPTATSTNIAKYVLGTNRQAANRSKDTKI
jgi:hypothetical protein